MLFGLALTNLIIIIVGLILFFFGGLFFQGESGMLLLFVVPGLGLMSIATSLILSSLIVWDHLK
jgi:hypothetical protein